MNVRINEKIPATYKNLPGLYAFLVRHGSEFSLDLCEAIKNHKEPPSNSNASWEVIANELSKTMASPTYFDFYTAKNPFFRRKVISHATLDDGANVVNYNRAFWGNSVYTIEDWVGNFFHELTHCADQKSTYSFDHKNQSDFKSAPFVVGALAEKLYAEKYRLNA